jgi:hypothetical protein
MLDLLISLICRSWNVRRDLECSVCDISSLLQVVLFISMLWAEYFALVFVRLASLRLILTTVHLKYLFLLRQRAGDLQQFIHRHQSTKVSIFRLPFLARTSISRRIGTMNVFRIVCVPSKKCIKWTHNAGDHVCSPVSPATCSSPLLFYDAVSI